MPTTKDRLWCLPLALRGWLRQLYRGPMELIVVSEHPETARIALAAGKRVRFVSVPEETTLGDKFSAGVLRAKHDWIALWADDDWYAPRRLSRTMTVATAFSAEMVGAASLLFHELIPPRRSFSYSWAGVDWIAGTTLLFQRQILSKVAFPSVARGVDTLFVRDAIRSGVKHKPFIDPQICVAMVHGQATGRSWDPAPPEYKPWTEDIYAILGPDLAEYERAFAMKRQAGGSGGQD